MAGGTLNATKIAYDVSITAPFIRRLLVTDTYEIINFVESIRYFELIESLDYDYMSTNMVTK